MKQEIITWLNNLAKLTGPPPKEVVAFNFGLLEDESGYTMYLAGAFEFTEDSDDWACVEMPTSPSRYLQLPEEMRSLEWEEVLEKSAEVLKELEEEGKLDPILFGNAVAITTGFDDGDLVRIR